MKKVHNYSAGPCILPREVFEEASQAVIDFNGTGLSILEMSHRSKEFEAVMAEARSLALEVLNVPKGYTALYLQGGASLGFLMVAMNMFREHKRGAYVNTGTWASGAIKECKNAGGEAVVVASSEDKNFNYIPKSYSIPADVDYFHYTSNNTIFGTQFKSIPDVKVPLICDMSSDIYSKPIDAGKFDLIYAGAQKNLGPAGATLYIIKEEHLGKSSIKIPTMLDFNTHATKESMYNTPPVFSIYVSLLTLRWLKKNGGVTWIAERNKTKAELLFNEIDSNPMFRGTCAVEDRSYMNPTFVMTDETHKAEFDTMWKAAGISGINGHRSVGGYRASMYNALPVESVQVLVDVMKEFANKYATQNV
jgi:phosphoserine aminotransferase